MLPVERIRGGFRPSVSTVRLLRAVRNISEFPWNTPLLDYRQAYPQAPMGINESENCFRNSSQLDAVENVAIDTS